MSSLVLRSEILAGALENRPVSRQDAVDTYNAAQDDPAELFEAARMLRQMHKKDSITFSKKAFLNVINLCRDTCSYCTYKAEPGQKKASMMSVQQTRDALSLAKRYGCVEALLVTGERPEQRYAEAGEWLRRNGFGSTAEYLAWASEEALKAGLFPHTNAGNLEYDELRQLQKTNVSMGIMLENVSKRLGEEGMPHHGAASKRPHARMKILENAGRLGIPMTTGVLVGIGETAEETIDSLVAIREIHKRYGNIQEVIVQNFQPKQDTPMGGVRPTDIRYFKRIVALARIIMPGTNIQIPPNLSPQYRDFVHLGINDWGGISPLTPDFVNPEFPWPGIDAVREHTSRAGYELECRFPVYPEFFPHVPKNLRDRMDEIGNGNGLVRRDYWQ